MHLAGLALAFIGFLVAAGSVGISDSNTVRLVLVLAGIAVSLFGILGPLNQHYQKLAVWRK